MRSDPEEPTMSEHHLSLNETLRWHYLDYVNNYLTVGVFTEHNGITKEQATQVISIGRELHEEYCEGSRSRLRRTK